MFATRVPDSLAARPLGGAGGAGAGSHFDTRHPLYRAIAALAALRSAQPALRRGRQLVRSSGKAPGLFAVSRFEPDSGAEVVIAFNTSAATLTGQVLVEAESQRFRALHGECQPAVAAPGSYRVEVPPLDYLVCAATSAP
jgi:glycosidase